MSVVPTDLATLLTDIENKLISDGIFQSNTCFVSLLPDRLTFPASDQFAVITPGRQDVDPDTVSGADPQLIYFLGEFTVTLWGRLALDQYPRDDIYLDDGTLGLLKIMKSVIVSLHLYQPTDTGGNPLNTTPRLRSVTTLAKKVPEAGWGAVVLSFSLEWNMDFS